MRTNNRHVGSAPGVEQDKCVEKALKYLPECINSCEGMMITSFDKTKIELDTASMYFNTQYVCDYGKYQSLFNYTPDFKFQGLV